MLETQFHGKLEQVVEAIDINAIERKLLLELVPSRHFADSRLRIGVYLILGLLKI